MRKRGFLTEFSMRLKNLRHTLGLTQDKFAEALGVSKPTYVRYEAAGMMPKIAFLRTLYNKFNVDLNWLIRGEGEMFVDKSHLAPPRIFSKRHMPKKYVELFRMMEIPEIELSIMMELEKAKRLFRSKVEKFSTAQKHKSKKAK